MHSFKVKTINLFTAAFLTMFFVLGFISFAPILVAFALYCLANRRVHFGDIRRAGIPALGAIFLVAVLSTITLSPYPFSAWNTGKDLYFFFAPILMLILGLTFINSPSDFERILTTAVKIFTIISIMLFSDFLFSGGVFNISLEARYSYGLDSTASTLALLLIISLRPTLAALAARSTLSALAILNLALIIASLSRVNISITFISLVFVYSHNRLIQSAVFVGTMFVIAAPLLQLSYIAPTGSTSGDFSFLGKLQNSLQEFRISNYSDLGDINENWRGYEAYLGIEQVQQVGGWANLIGVGFGSFARGPFVDKLTLIPYFHNGFVTIFLKSGTLGIAFFTIFSGKLYMVSRLAFLQARSNSDQRVTCAALIIFLFTNSMLMRTLTTHGVYYAKTTLELFFIGLSIYVIGRLQRDRARVLRFCEDESHLEPQTAAKAER
ncbi:hypothetical protein ACEWPM_017050 [Roseovarius sp. S4756]|uniref:hypothetical protein n=1 Tax=Roseovarius maritimus TaxID=3342637 RepID=UPI003729BB67